MFLRKNHSKFSTRLGLSLFAMLAFLPVGYSNDSPKAPASPVTGAEGTEVAPPLAQARTGLSSFGKNMPAGLKNVGVTIPGFTKGKPSSLVLADSVTRIDENRLMAENMTIQMFAEDPRENVTVDLKSATYHMTNQVLRSATRSKVTRSDFELEGDSLVFDTMTSQGKMVGNVRMVIYDASMLKPAATKSEPKAGEDKSAAGSSVVKDAATPATTVPPPVEKTSTPAK